MKKKAREKLEREPVGRANQAIACGDFVYWMNLEDEKDGSPAINKVLQWHSRQVKRETKNILYSLYQREKGEEK